jgi:hypothetical protein
MLIERCRRHRTHKAFAAGALYLDNIACTEILDRNDMTKCLTGI